jgi:hypothetical protein
MASDKTTMTTRRYLNMQSPIRALLYGIAIWFVWVSLVVFSAEILPTGISGSPPFVSMQMVPLAAFVLIFGMPSDGYVARYVAARKTNASRGSLPRNLPFGRYGHNLSANSIDGNRCQRWRSL